MKKTFAVLGFLTILAVSGSAFATCAPTGDGCTPPTPPPPQSTCGAGPCGGSFDTWTRMEANTQGVAYASGPNAKTFTGGLYDMISKVNIDLGAMKSTAEVQAYGGYQSAQTGPGKIYGGASGLGEFRSTGGYIIGPYNQPNIPGFPQ